MAACWRSESRARNGIQIFFFLILVVCLEKRELKSKQTQAANKGSLCFAKCLAHKNISNEMLLNWQLSPALGGETVSVVPSWCLFYKSFVFIPSVIGWLDRLFCIWEGAFEQPKHTLIMIGLRVKQPPPPRVEDAALHPEARRSLPAPVGGWQWHSTVPAVTFNPPFG